MDTIYINTDGGSRGNPGPAGIGVVFSNESGDIIHTFKKCIGKATNNEAEYEAIVCALDLLLKSQWFAENNIVHKKVICRLDSQLVVEQVNGNYKVKQEHLKKYIEIIQKNIALMHLNISFVHVRREENKMADKLVNEALDAELKK